MGAPPTLERLNYRHDAIILWLLTHPDRPLGDCAEFFGYTQPWLSRIIHTDMFQAAYRAKAEELGVVTIHDVKSKILNLASAALDQATERIQSGLASDRFLGETMKNTLASLGYGAPIAQVAGSNQQNNFFIGADVLTAARERAAQVHEGTTQAKLGAAEPQAVDAEFEDLTPRGPVQ